MAIILAGNPRIISTAPGWTQPHPRATLWDPFGRGIRATETIERISEAAHGYRHNAFLRFPPGAPRSFLLDGPRYQGNGKPPLVSRHGCRPRPSRGHPPLPVRRDRKSTRLNSSHSQISYAVFCLKKKKNTKK